MDRSAAYAARWVAVSLVKAGLVRRVLVQLSYAIGIAEPLNITVFSYGTATVPDDDLQKVVRHNFDLRPGKIVQELSMKSPIYRSADILLIVVSSFAQWLCEGSVTSEGMIHCFYLFS